MGDRANIHVRENSEDNGVFLYSHWTRESLPKTLQKALNRRLRWDDTQYLTRIIFDQMTEKYHGGETGFGISAFLGDGEDSIIEVNVENQTVTIKENQWSFEEFVNLENVSFNRT